MIYIMLIGLLFERTIDEVDEHLELIEIIRKYMDRRGDTRKLKGAVTGEIVSEAVLNYANKKGLYVVVQSGDAVAIAAGAQGFTAREW